MASPLTARSQSAPGVICTKTLTTAIPFPHCLHLNSEPGRKRLGKRQKLQTGAAAVPDRNYHRCRARFAHGCTAARTICTLIWAPPGLTAKCGECAAPVSSRRLLKVPPRPLSLCWGPAPKGSYNYSVSTTRTANMTFG